MTTDQNTRQNTEVRALRMLRTGDSVRNVSQATGLTTDEVLKLQRDFPGPPAAPIPARQPAAPAPTDTGGPLTIARLLEEASGHSSTRIRNLAQRIEERLDDLRARIAEEAEAENARRLQQAAREAARAEIARLEEQLRAAKAKLGRGGAARRQHQGNSKPRTPAQLEVLAKGRAAMAAKRAAAREATEGGSP